MLTPHRFASRVGKNGIPLPDPFFTLAVNRVQFRRDGTSMIAGAPGSFKSVFALNMLVNWAREGIGILYVSADSDEFTVVKRLSGIISGTNIETVESSLMAGGPARARYQEVLRELENVKFVYMQMDLDRISVQVKAYEAAFGAYPDVIFLDNLIDIVEAPDDWGGMLTLTRDLDGFAREIHSHICVLHHAKIQSGNSSAPGNFKPPADWEVQGKVTQIPRLVLTMAAQGLSLRVACVKNTNGPQDRSGGTWMDFQVLTSMRVQDTGFTMGRA